MLYNNRPGMLTFCKKLTINLTKLKRVLSLVICFVLVKMLLITLAMVHVKTLFLTLKNGVNAET